MFDFRQIARELNVSHQRVDQIYQGALEKFRRRWVWIMGEELDLTTFERTGKLGDRFETLEDARVYWHSRYGIPFDYYELDGNYHIRFSINRDDRVGSKRWFRIRSSNPSYKRTK